MCIKTTFTIIAPVSSLSNRTRLFKLANFLFNDKKVNSLKHIAWIRDASEAIEKELPTHKIETKALITGGGYGGKLTKLLYIWWMLRVFGYCLLRKDNSPIWALGFETAFPALLAAKIRKFDIIFDDADRFSLVFPFPSFIKRCIQALEEYTSTRVLMHVIPGEDRYKQLSKNMFTLKNTPSREELSKAKKLYRENNWPTSKIIININGWLGKDRGMNAALYIANKFQSDEIKFIVAGKVDCKAAQELISLDNVSYLGKVSNAMALASYFSSDYVLTYYDPAIEINKFAQSNKWGDALSTNTNIIVNSEVKTAKSLRKYPGTIMVPYHDTDLLIKILRQKLTTFKEQQTNCSGTQPVCFEQQLHDLFNKAIC
ncbi:MULTISPECIES: glycosyltransferase family protein [Thalassotalea]|uniref:hypothetical protein n=1 Tax=Thalassotalea TaxID=1518149 RepID=UPI000941F8E5|nr:MULTISPECIES: hypothetical protein [Thalassotalea]OKY26755.1 hypothetical protein BI291_01820 [Thalassotalea sp. PP2-459]